MAIEREQAAPGLAVTLRIRFKVGETLVDPYEVRQVVILDPSDTAAETITSITRDGVGLYSVVYAIPEDADPGLYHDRWYATYEAGGTESQFTLNFFVQPAAAAEATYYLTTAEAKEYLPEGTALTDGEIQEALELCQEVIETICGQKFIPQVETRTFDGSGGRVLNVVRPIQEVSNVEIYDCYADTWREVPASTLSRVRISQSGTVLAYGNPYFRTLRFPSFYCGFFPRGMQNVRVTGTWGLYDAPPAQIKHALGLLVRFACSEDDPHGNPGAEYESESIGGDRSYQTRRVWAGSAKTNGATGVGQVDSILVRFQAAPTVMVI